MAEKKHVIIERKVTKCLPCKLTNEESLQYGKDISRAYADLTRLEAQLAATKQEFKYKIEETEGFIGKLTTRVHSGEENRDVACLEVKNWTEGTVKLTRLDTLAVIESRPMREDEKQAEMKLQDDKVENKKNQGK